jgi:hypothetical protein
VRASGSPVAGYKIYATTSPDEKGSGVIRTAEGAGATVTGLTNGTVYFFRVTAFDAAGNESSFSTPASAEPSGGDVPIVPANHGWPTRLITTLLAAAAAAALALIARYKHVNSQKNKKDHEPPVASGVRAEPGITRRDAVSIRETGQEPTRTIRLIPHSGVTTTTLKETRK